MSSYGVIFTGFGTKEYIHQSLAPWVALRGAAHRDDSIFICAVSVKFAGFEGEDDGTREILREHLVRGEIDHLIDGPDNIPETTARGMALAWLRDVAKVDMTIMWDSDEESTVDELSNAISFMEQDPFTVAWRFSYRNLVFTPDQWLADPFTPMRAHRLKQGSYVADRFYDDNNILYRGTVTRDFRQDVSFATRTVPSTILSPKHYTWLSDTLENKARSRAKERYQKDRGWQCSFRWNPETDQLEWNEVYYRERGLPLPRVFQSGSSIHGGNISPPADP